MSANQGIDAGPELTVCVLGPPEAGWLEELRAGLPAAVALRLHDTTEAGAVLHELVHDGCTGPVVLLRADTLLPRLWLPRILAALEAEDVVAAAPLEVADLGSLAAPRDAGELQLLDALCHAHGLRHPLPAARLDAPLLALRAAALPLVMAVGEVLDADALPAPWRLVRLADILVARGGATRAAAPPLLPDVGRAVAAAFAAGVPDPGLPGLDGKPVVLHVLHGWGGGAERWVRDLAGADTERHHLLLQSHGSFRTRRHGEAFTLADARAPDQSWRSLRPSRPIADTAQHHAGYDEFLATAIADCGVGAVVVSSLIGHGLGALATGLPTSLVVHDHYPLWPVLHCDFSAPDLNYDRHLLERMLAAVGDGFEFAHRDAGYWLRLRDAFIAVVQGARAAIVAPSRSALAAELRLAPELGELRHGVIPHGLAPWQQPATVLPPPPRERLRLVVPGRIRGGKAQELLEVLVPALGEYAELVLLGAGSEGMEFFGQAGIHVVLDYAREDLPGILARLQPDAAFLPATVSETFSYTLSELRSLGIPVIATDVGALGDRIDDGVDGLLVPATADALMYLAALAADRTPLEAVRRHLQQQPEPIGLAPMAAAWGRVLGNAAAPRPALFPAAGTTEQALVATRAAREHLRAELADAQAELAELQHTVEQRVEWALSLERANRKATGEVSQLQEELAERTDWAQSLDAEVTRLQPLEGALATLQAEHERILGSRSWRITRPLRATATFLRRLRTSIVYRLSRLRSLGGRFRGSLARRGVRGTVKRIQAEFEGQQTMTPPITWPEPKEAVALKSLPTSSRPLVSIVIPVYNKYAYTAACLQSIAEHTRSVPFEVIVVDDFSTDETGERLAEIDGVWLLRNSENLGFVGSCNAGASLARGEFILFLNNDTLVTAGWLQALVDCFAAHQDAGLVGARLIYPDGRLQEAGGIVFSDASGWNYGRFRDPEDPRFGFLRETDYCSGAAIMLRRELFERLGGFDMRYAPAYYEDTDLAFQVRAAGFRVYVVSRSTVVHFEGVSNGTDVDAESGLKRYQKINQVRFLEKWHDTLASFPPSSTDPARMHLVATRRARARVLIIDASTPEPDQDSGSVRLVNIMRILCGMGCQVSFLPDNLARFPKYTAQLQELGVEALYHPFVEGLPRFYQERGHEFDMIMVSRHYVLAHHMGLIRLHAPQALLVFDTVDLHYLREARAVELDPRPEMKRQAESTRKQELRLIEESDVTLVVSRVEQELLATDAPNARVEVLSNVHEIHGTRTGFAARRDLLFVGGFQHPPNTDAMIWFVREVLPLVHVSLPDVAINIVGSKMTKEVEALADSSVIVHGYVPDLVPLLERARIAVAPLRYGAGVKGKVNMAMSYGLPVVATPMAVEGIDVEPGRDVLVGADPADFAGAVVRLYQDAELWASLSRNGLENVRRQFSFGTARVTLESLLRR